MHEVRTREAGSSLELSVIVPTRDRPRHLEALLGSLARQVGVSGFGWDVIVVDDASSDAARADLERVLSNWNRAPLIYIRLPQRRWPAGARNAGAGRSRASILLFADDDLVLEERALAETRRLHAAYPDIDVLNGQLRKLRDDYFSRFWHHHYDAVFNRKVDAEGPYPVRRVSGFVAFQRRILERFWPLYDESLPACEDFDLYLRLREASINSYKDDRIVAYHDFRRGWSGLVRQRLWYAQGQWALRRKYGPARLQEVYRSEPPIPRNYRFLPGYLSIRTVELLWRIRQRVQARRKGHAVDRSPHS